MKKRAMCRTLSRSLSPSIWTALISSTLANVGVVFVSILFVYTENAFAANRSLGSTQFTVSGNVSTTVYSPAGNPRNQSVTLFAVHYASGKWLIRSSQLRNGLSYIETGFDGTNYMTYVPLPRIASAKSGTLNDGGTGILDKGPIPHIHSVPLHSVLWLTFCSREVITRETKESEPLFLTSHLGADFEEIFRFGVKFKTAIESDEQTRIKRITYLHDGKIRGWSRPQASWVAKPTEILMPAPFNAGYTSAVFVAEGFVAARDANIPQDFRYSVYEADLKNLEPARTYLLQEFKGTVTNYLPACALSQFQPVITGRVMAVERRFTMDEMPVHQFNYLFKDAWKTEDQVRRDPAFSRQLIAQGYTQPAIMGELARASHSAKKRRILVYSGFIVLAILGLLYLRHSFSNRQNAKAA